MWGKSINVSSIDASAITSGVIDAARIPDLDAAKIISGILNAARIPNLDASKITSGVMAKARIDTANVWLASEIPDLDASKIVSGTMAKARIDTTNQWLTSEIPSLDTAKITTGTLDLARLPASVKKLVGVVIKPSDTTRTATTAYADDPHLTVAIEANKRYVVFMGLIYLSPAAADIKFTFTLPAAVTAQRRTGGNLSSSNTASASGDMTGDMQPATTDATKHYLSVMAQVVNGANAGNITLQWAQQTSDAGNTTVHAGSFLMVWEA